MPRILYGVSPIGLGHAARSVAVGRELEKLGAAVTFATGGNALAWMREYGLTAEGGVTEPVPRVVDGRMKDAAMWYVRYWRDLRRSARTMGRLIEAVGPDLVVGDEEFSGVREAMGRGLPSALISDELELGFARGPVASLLESRAERWYRQMQASVPLLIIPEEGEDAGNRCYVGPVVRPPTMTPSETRQRFGLPTAGRMVLFSSSGGDLVSHYLLRKALEAFAGSFPGDFMAVTGNRLAQATGEAVYDLGVVRENQDLVAAADLVVTTAGKSTIDEAASEGTPIIAIPVKDHAEQERNAAALGFRSEDALRLKELMAERIGKRGRPKHHRGAAKAAQLLVAAATRSV